MFAGVARTRLELLTQGSNPGENFRSEKFENISVRQNWPDVVTGFMAAQGGREEDPIGSLASVT